MTIKEIEEKKMIGYKYVRGSHSQNLDGPDSDKDFGGIYFTDYEKLMGLGEDYEEEVSDERHDETYHEFGKWMGLLSKGNPNALESLFIPKEMVVGEINPVVQRVIDNREKFISKEVVKALSGYAFNQVKKARGLGKKIVNPITERKDILDFCYRFKNQGSQPIKDFLNEHQLDQKYCGLVDIPNMPNTYGVYYDWAAYFHFENIDWESDWYDTQGNRWKWFFKFGDPKWNDSVYYVKSEIQERIRNKEFFHYEGIVHPDDYGKSNDVRLSSIPKGERPICTMVYNKDAYTCHCREYKEYQEWVEKRNQKRYSKAIEAGYNQKNMCHCIRLLTMAKEIVDGKGFNLWRTEDRDFLMGIKDGNYTYEYLLEYAENLLKEVNEKINTCNLPDEVDKEFVNQLLIDCRKEYYGK